MTDRSRNGGVLADWFRAHATPLESLDPGAPLDDLDDVREIIGTARIVAIGENAHFVDEFSLARQRLIRFLAERCGFTTVAYEFGFGEAFALQPWLQGAGAPDDLAAISPAATAWGAEGMMRWLRGHNLASGRPVRFAGIDLPEAGGALRPVLDPVADYLSEADPDALPVLTDAVRLSDAFLAGLGSGAAAAPAWAATSPADRHALTAALARVRLRLQAMAPSSIARCGRDRYEVALRQVEAACHTDYMFGAVHDLMNGSLVPGDMSVRENFMAESVGWHLAHAGPDARVIVVAHNNHIQKTPVAFGGTLTALPMGQHLQHMFGSDYVALALTHTADHVPEMYPDADASVGFTVADAHLPTPGPNTVEGALFGANLHDRITVTDLRDSPRDTGGASLLTGIRTQSAVLDTTLPAAFDAVLAVPTVTTTPSIRF
ncbi:erythromycin esterase family protein [Nocardia sp. BMG51109]|uniref:erythromycin esterase family protein n=1 Tax=Nocardia sp. BMG51109 TaxID=1056816 RepID=UPI0004B914EB|nr:erythromycin esterase family protein [Nocardia sp. BMG51109]